MTFTSASEWLAVIGLPQYAELFERNRIAPDVIPDLTERDLQDLDIPLGDRKRLLKAVAAFPGTSGRQTSAASVVPGAGLSMPQRASLESERKQVTVLFADLKGSMELLADRDPEESRQILDPIIEHMMAAVQYYGGTVNQIMGDGIMALFGAPQAQEDHAVRACYAALRMQEAVRGHAELVRRTEGVAIQIRVGLNSGEVMVRLLDNDLRTDYTAVGPSTHLAARMEQLALPGTTAMSGETLKLAEGFVQARALGPMKVKGLDAPVEVFELVGASTARTRLQALASRGLTRFVGRDAEMDALCRAFEQARQGHGQVVAVVGEAGVGKSRLFHEFTHSHRTHSALVLEAGSVSYGKASGYRPVLDLLKGYFGIEERDDGRRLREKVAGKLLMLDRELERLLSPLLFLLGAPIDDSEWQRLDPSLRRQRILTACKRLLFRESQVQQLVLVFEDLHWVDAESQAMLDSLVDGLVTTRILLLCNYRPEYEHHWGLKSHYTQLRIDPLDSESTTTLLRSLLGDDPSLESVKRLVMERTEGNPLFLEESVRTLAETGQIAGSRGAYRLTGTLTALQIASSVQAILAARIDRLAPEDKRLLQAASVVGKDVPYALLESIAAVPEYELRHRLGSLQSADLLYEASIFPELEYTFKHALTHEVAYSGVLQDRRRALHASVVNAVEQINVGRLDEHVERLAHHALRGEVWEKALMYLRRAGEKAVARSANRDAAAYFEQAIGALAHLPQDEASLQQAVDLRLGMHWCWMPLGGLTQVADYARAALPIATALGDPRRQALCHCSMNSAILGQSAEAIEHARAALDIAERLDEPVLHIIAKWFLGLPHLHMGSHEEAVQIFEMDVGLDGKAAAQSLLDRPGNAGSYQTFAVYTHGIAEGDASHSLAELGRFEEAMSHVTYAIDFAARAGSLVLQAFHQIHLGFVHMRRGEHEQALGVAESWLRTFNAEAMPLALQALASRVGPIFVLCDRLADGIALYESARQLSESNGLVAFLQPELCWLAQAHGRAGDTGSAFALAQRALALAREHHQRGNEAWTLYVLGELHRGASRPDAALDAYAGSLEIARELHMRPLQAQCLLAMAELDSTQVQLLATEARSMFAQMRMPAWIRRTERVLAAG